MVRNEPRKHTTRKVSISGCWIRVISCVFVVHLFVLIRDFSCAFVVHFLHQSHNLLFTGGWCDFARKGFRAAHKHDVIFLVSLQLPQRVSVILHVANVESA